MMKDGFISSADQELVSTGETKAENTITWARNALKQRGYINRAARRGMWELTPEGKSAAAKVTLPKPG
jgi:restriction endonuclease Mrr